MIVCYDVLDLRTHLAFFGNGGWHDLIFDDYLIVPINGPFTSENLRNHCFCL